MNANLSNRAPSVAIKSALIVAMLGIAPLCRSQEETPERAAALLARGPAPLLMANQDHGIAPLPDGLAEKNPLESAVLKAREALVESRGATSPSNMNRDAYLAMIDGVVMHFRHFQADNGRIIDPYLQREYQYSTPAYALDAALLVSTGRRPELLGSASRALDSSLYQLASGTPNDRHGDFFIVPTMLAYCALRDHVDAATRARWDRYLQMIKPGSAYSDLIGPGQRDVINWNTNAISGEFLRHKLGFTDATFVERYVAEQRPHLTAEGLYREPGTPLTYDASARFNLALLLHEGYAGPQKAALETLLARGAWTSLLIQSPLGDFPAGGRTSEHVWNDTLECASFELWARMSKARGDAVGMRAFKRAAHLAAQSAARWIRPSGEFWIVKNHFDPALRHGFEEYSSHSQYNLLAAAYLAMAWLLADEDIPEGLAPADVGGFMVELPAFHKVFANSGGHYVEIETAADPHYNSTGLLRDSRPGMEPALGPGVNAPIAYGPLAVGAAWRVAGQWQSLAQFAAGSVKAEASLISATAQKVGFRVHYQLTDSSIKGLTETYWLTPTDVTVAIRFDDAVERWKAKFPAFASDGKSWGQLSLDKASASVRSGESRQRFELLDPARANLVRTGSVVGMRNGYYEVIEGEGDGDAFSYRIGQ
ncbi:MAG TPA: hypothetical protein VNU71_01140 [Burkholderiaceae bacterium]|nr:hypothetical protein [Burkholderiaceae bacterium]